jgi:hypothetical protein
LLPLLLTASTTAHQHMPTMQAQPCVLDHATSDAAAAAAGPRCQHDSAVLPNGKVLLINGVEEGFSGLGFFPVSVIYRSRYQSKA